MGAHEGHAILSVSDAVIHEHLSALSALSQNVSDSMSDEIQALADRVLHLRNGTIVEQGTHERLSATSASYRYVMGSVHG